MAKQPLRRINTAEDELDLGELIRLLLSKILWLILAAALAGGATYAVMQFAVAPKYTSRVSFYVYNSPELNNGTVTSSDLNASTGLANTYSVILKSDRLITAVRDAVIAAGELNDSQFALLSDLDDYVSANQVSGTQLIEVSVTTTSAKVSYEAAKAYANVASNEIQTVTRGGGAEVVDSPRMPRSPSSPQKMRNAMIGALGGAVLAAAIVILNAMTNSTLVTPDDITTGLEGVLLGEIPQIIPDEKNSKWTIREGGVLKSEKKNEKVSELSL